tara:strand:- start:42 stop:296 length:255 start_codon:yes stop_codon:yes gene_type:complete
MRSKYSALADHCLAVFPLVSSWNLLRLRMKVNDPAKAISLAETMAHWLGPLVGDPATAASTDCDVIGDSFLELLMCCPKVLANR